MSIELDIVRDVAERLTRAGIPFMLAGSMAMNAYAHIVGERKSGRSCRGSLPASRRPGWPACCVRSGAAGCAHDNDRDREQSGEHSR